ncbi:Secoisolariciresinol dehydrogenase [Sesamum alatum]|uniref:Secoisolariciresinol dehydrogenase n=1 Tax=Sesamum alatum TaxID=300844 RepID=A0AAE1Z396_9LAMI|nr:Secoisolariciresinol dehydrogenase [Sesamum alatum]
MASTSLLSAVAKRLEGKVALITGGAGGLGSVTAKLFHEHGAKVLIADVRDDQGHLLCQNLSPETASFIHCDVTNESDIRKAVETAVSRHGKLDIMFNNAGIVDPLMPDIVNYNQAEFERVLRHNVVGAFLGTKHAARFMKQAKQGSIINTASVCSVISGVATHGYASSKHAVLGLTRNTAVELGHYGIRVNCVSPHVFPSSMSRGFLGRDEDDPMDDVCSVLEGVSLKAEDVAQAVVYLGSDESRCEGSSNIEPSSLIDQKVQNCTPIEPSSSDLLDEKSLLKKICIRS